ERASTLVLNTRYRRPAPKGRETVRWITEEIAAAALVWLVAGGGAGGAEPPGGVVSEVAPCSVGAGPHHPACTRPPPRCAERRHPLRDGRATDRFAWTAARYGHCGGEVSERVGGARRAPLPRPSPLSGDGALSQSRGTSPPAARRAACRRSLPANALLRRHGR